MQVEVAEYLLDDFVLRPHIILAVAQEQQVADADLREDGVAVGDVAVDGFASVVQQAHGVTANDVEVCGDARQHLGDYIVERAVCGSSLDGFIVHTARVDVSVVGILQGTQGVDAVDFEVIKHLVVGLVVALRLHITGEDAGRALVDVHDHAAACRREEVADIVGRLQADGGALPQQVVETVVHLIGDVHRVGSKEHASAVADFHCGSGSAAGKDVHGNRVAFESVE